MGKIKWAAIPVVATTLLLVAVAAVLLRGVDRSTARQATPEQAARQEPSAAQQVSKAAPVKPAAAVAAPRTKAVASRPAARPAKQNQVAPAKVAAKPQSVAPENNLGWRLGTEWTVVVEEYADYLAEAQTVTVTYRYKVVGVDAAKKSFTVSKRFANPANQPESARGDLVRAATRWTVAT